MRSIEPRIYQELHRLAVDFMNREREEPVLQATALVHAVYLKLVYVQEVTLEGKVHFLAICAQMMALNDALDKLARSDPRKARVVELRYFDGYCTPSLAAALLIRAKIEEISALIRGYFF